MNLESRRRRYRRINLSLIAAGLLLGFAVTFGAAYFARELQFTFLGWPFDFWVAAQGALLVYLAIVAGYAVWMDRLDAEFEREGGGDG